jgi:hypothetical protein
MNKQDLMECRNWRMGTCPKSDPVVLQEDSQYLQMGCKTCRGGWIVTMPDGKAKARYENRVAELKRLEKEERERQSKRLIFT